MSTNAARAARPANAAVACFSVLARAEPGIMPRVLGLFAKRGLVPTGWRSAVAAGELEIDIQMLGLAGETADYLAACLRQIVGVEVVLTSEKHHPASGAA